MEIQAAKGVFDFIREGGLLAVSILLSFVVYRLFTKLIAEKDAHRETSDVIVKLATELAGLVRDLNAKRIPRHRSPSSPRGPENPEGTPDGGGGPPDGERGA